MRPVLLQLVAAAGSLVLALPPGWCCPPVRHVRPESAPVPSTCCHGRVPDRPADPEPPQAPVKAECCCQQEATVPEQPVQPPEPAVLAEPHMSGDPALVAGHVRADMVGVVAPPGPPLHVLQCVWRC